MSKISKGVRPDYYGPGGIYEPVKVIDAWGLSFRVATALAYMCRAGKKPGVSAIDDLEKAHTFLGMEIEKILEDARDAEKEPVSHGADMPAEPACLPQPGPDAPFCGLGAVQGDSRGLESLLNREVTVHLAHSGQASSRGVVLAVCDAPQALVDDGANPPFWWRVNLLKVVQASQVKAGEV